MIQDEQQYKDSVVKSRDEAHKETMWGKPARDIITGIGNCTNVRPVRAIWELVQNARDVVKPGCRAHILFTCKENELIFQHDGEPFTHKTIEALILQTSSKAADNQVEVGQYGTGFLTTHKFGLKFKLKAPLLTSEEYKRYCIIPDFEIDRSSTDKETMRKAIEAQCEEVKKWGTNFEETSEEPIQQTTFTYLYDSDKAKQNAVEAFAEAPVMTPYVMLLNPQIESIAYNDDARNDRIAFELPQQQPQKVGELGDGVIYKNTVTIDDSKNNREAISLYYIESCEQTEQQPSVPKATVILPIREKEDGKLYAFRFGHEIPQIYIYLPLLGTEKWGFNFLFHSSLFTCDRDSRDSLRIVGNGQNNDHQAELNKTVIDLVNKLIWQFIEKYIDQIEDAKYLLQVNFKIQQPNEELAEYYMDLQKTWREKFEWLEVVETENGDKLVVNDISVLDEELQQACIDSSELLDAVYQLITRSGLWKVPHKEDLLYWSKTINEWYRNEDNPHKLSIDKLMDGVPAPSVEENDLQWLHVICQYIVRIGKAGLFNQKKLIPNDNLTLQFQEQLKKPVGMADVVRRALEVMAPEVVEGFVHPMFCDIINDNVYDYPQIKDCITNYLNNHNSDQNSIRNEVMRLKGEELSKGIKFDTAQYSDKAYPVKVIQCMLDLLKSVMAEDTSGFGGKMLRYFEEFYGLKARSDEGRLDKLYGLEDRAFYNAMIYDSLFNFTLLSQVEKTVKADWIKPMVKEVYGFSDAKSFLLNYQVYPDPKGVYKYADWLYKQPSDTPDRALEIYDEVVLMPLGKSIKEELVSKDFSDCFQGNQVLDSIDRCKKIEEEVAKMQYNLNGCDFKNQIVEIINHLTTEGTEREQWKRLFTDIDNNKGQLMLSTLQDQARKDSLFSLIQIEDATKLKRISELANDPQMEQILELGRKELQRIERDNSDIAFKKDLGEYVERIVKNELNLQLGDDSLRIKPVENEQGGQDLIVHVNHEKVYYIEVKSRWASDKSVLMSTLQHRTSYEQKDRYALCVVDMVGVDKEDVRLHKYPPFEDVENRIVVLENIGKLNETLKAATENNDNVVHVNGGYQVLVSQKVIENNAVTFHQFLDDLKAFVKLCREQSF